MKLIEPVVVAQPEFYVTGITIAGTLQEIEQQLGEQAKETLLAREEEIINRLDQTLYLIQLFPKEKPEYRPEVDAVTQIIGFKVPVIEHVPEGMICHTVPGNQYVVYTHRGPESELRETYNYLYGSWMKDTNHQPQGYHYEVWEDRVQPGSEIDIFIALQCSWNHLHLS